VSPDQLARTPDFDGVVDLCVPRLHDRQFWRDLKGRITDPDPGARAPVVGEVATAERRIVAYQSEAPARWRDPDLVRRRHRHASPGGRVERS